MSGDTVEFAKVVWWALVVGGFCGGLVRLFVKGFEMPYVNRIKTTGQTVWVPGFLTDVIVAPVAALLLQGLGASTFLFQSGYDDRSFWGPFISSMLVGLGGAQVLAPLIDKLAAQQIEKIQDNLLK